MIWLVWLSKISCKINIIWNSQKLLNMLHQSRSSHILHPHTSNSIQRLDRLLKKQLKKKKMFIADFSHWHNQPKNIRKLRIILPTLDVGRILVVYCKGPYPLHILLSCQVTYGYCQSHKPLVNMRALNKTDMTKKLVQIIN